MITGLTLIGLTDDINPSREFLFQQATCSPLSLCINTAPSVDKLLSGC